MSANFRALFHLQYCQWAKHPKSAESLWPLDHIDQQIEQLSEEEMYKRNKAIIEHYYPNSTDIN